MPIADPGLAGPVSPSLFFPEEVTFWRWGRNYGIQILRDIYMTTTLIICLHSPSLNLCPGKMSEPWHLPPGCSFSTNWSFPLCLSPSPLLLRLHRMSLTMGNLALCAAIAAKHTCALSCSSLREGDASSAAFAAVSMMVCSLWLGLGGDLDCIFSVFFLVK